MCKEGIEAARQIVQKADDEVMCWFVMQRLAMGLRDSIGKSVTTYGQLVSTLRKTKEDQTEDEAVKVAVSDSLTSLEVVLFGGQLRHSVVVKFDTHESEGGLWEEDLDVDGMEAALFAQYLAEHGWEAEGRDRPASDPWYYARTVFDATSDTWITPPPNRANAQITFAGQKELTKRRLAWKRGQQKEHYAAVKQARLAETKLTMQSEFQAIAHVCNSRIDSWARLHLKVGRLVPVADMLFERTKALMDGVFALRTLASEMGEPFEVSWTNDMLYSFSQLAEGDRRKQFAFLASTADLINF